MIYWGVEEGNGCSSRGVVLIVMEVRSGQFEQDVPSLRLMNIRTQIK